MSKAAKKASKRAKSEPEQEEEESQDCTPEDLARAQRLIFAVSEALPQIDKILKTTNCWSEDRNTPPPLLKQSASWRDAVDPKTFKQFGKLIDFLRDALFGVDCDNDSAVQFVLRDCGREEDFLPSFRVPRIGDRATIRQRFEQLELAKSNLKCIQSRIESMERVFMEMDLKKIIQQEDRRQKAKDCTVCKGKGWIETDADTWHALDYGEKCRTADIGCNYTAKPTDKYYKTFRLFCECQNESEDEGDSEDDD